MRIVIRAGGTGTRLWPWSLSTRPKQFLPMFGGRSCVQMAYDRFVGSGLVAAGDVYVSVGQAHTELAREQLPQLPEGNVIVEPAKMDTGAAIGLETVVVAGEGPSVNIASLGSDHFVERPEEFVRALRAADEFLSANPDYLLAIAAEPTRVETNYGHIRKGSVLGDHEGMPVYEGAEFLEKPDRPTAERYTSSGEYLWNANFFVWPSDMLMAQFAEFEPEMHCILKKIAAAREEGRLDEAIRELYPTLKKVAVDYAVLEPAAAKGRLAVLPVSMGWSDIGTWSSITDALAPDGDGNLLVGPVKAVDTRDTTVYSVNPSRKVITTIGLEGMAVVETEEALLVCPKALSARVKDVVDALKRDAGTEGLV